MISALHVELNVVELLGSLNETLTAGGDAEHTQTAIESEIARYAKGMKIQGYSDGYIASVLGSVALTYINALSRAAVLAVEEPNTGEPSEFLSNVLKEML